MIFLNNQNRFNFAVNWKSQAYSPFHQFVNDIQNKKSKLFPDRKRIPGRKTKFIIAIALVVQFFSISKLVQAKRVWQFKSDEQVRLQRKVAPYFQSISDIQYTIVRHKYDLTLAQIFKQKGGIEYLQKKRAYHNPAIFVPPPGRGGGIHVWSSGGLGRYAESPQDKLFNVYLPGHNIQNA